MAGQSLPRAELTERGVLGDRVWALRDEASGGFRCGKRYSPLMSMKARLDAEPTQQAPSPQATIQLPDGRTVTTGDSGVNERLSEALGAEVSLWPLLPASDTAHYRRRPPPPGTDVEAYLREVFARTDDEPLPDLSSFPQTLSTYESPPGTYFDAFALLLVTEASLAALSAASAAAVFDVRRFRPNVVLSTPAHGFVENGWAGRTARLGQARLRFEMACPRCVMTTHPVDELPRDPGIMRTLVRENDGNLGIYANVVKAGVVTVGDRLIFD